MKILILCSGNPNQEGVPFDLATHHSFIYEQMQSLNKLGVETGTFFIRGKGIAGYLKNLGGFKKAIREGKYDLVHAHNGLSGVLACLQRRLPVITSFHGSDLCELKKRIFSYLPLFLSAYVIYVSDRLKKIGSPVRKKNYAVIPCGIDLETFYEIAKEEARKRLNMALDRKYALFSSSFNKKVKNFPLAREAAEQIPDLEIIELKGYGREEVNLLLNACDVLLVSSFRESGPQVVKEAMACNCPIVSTDVGYARELMTGIDGCYISSFNTDEFAECIKRALQFGKRTNGRRKVLHLSNDNAAREIKEIYEKLMSFNTHEQNQR